MALAGKPELRLRGKELAKLDKGGEVFWDSRGGPPAVRAKSDDPAGQADYFAKLRAYPDARRAEPVLMARAEFARKLDDPRRVRVALDEAMQGVDGQLTPQKVAAATTAVAGFAALCDLPGLAGALTDKLPAVREAAGFGLRSALACDPPKADQFRKYLVEKNGVAADQADFALRLLRGFTPEERAVPETLDLLVDGMAAPAVQARELAFQNVRSYLGLFPPDDPVTKTVPNYDAAAPDEFREPQLKAWKRKAEEIKKKLAAP